MPVSSNGSVHDPLLECLALFTKLYHEPYSAEALTEGLPTEDGAVAPELFTLDRSKANFSRAAGRAGLSTKLVRRDLDEIPAMVLPCILLLHNRGACILEEIDDAEQKAKVILPEIPDGEQWMELDTLNDQYLGFAFFLKKERSYDKLRRDLVRTHREHWFWGTLRKSKTIYRDVLLASVLINLFVIAAPLFTMNVYDRVVPNNAIETMWVLATGIIVVFFFDMALKFLRTYFLEVAGKKSDVIMSSLLFEQVMNLKMANRPHSVGSFASNMREFESIRNFFTSTTVATLIDLPFVVIFLAVTYFIAGPIVIAPVTVILLIFFYSLFIRKPLQQSVESAYEATAAKNAVLVESLNNIETLKTMGAGGHAQYHWEEATGDIAEKGLKSRILSSSILTVTSFLIQLNTVLVLITGVYMIEAMELTMGGLIASVILTARAIAPMGQFAALLANYQQMRTALENLNDIMQLPVERPEGKRFIHRPSLRGKIRFDNVVFTYPGESKATLNGVSFTINPGERVGLIGRIGSGKSTIEKLIMNLYQPDSGSIAIDDIDISQIDPADLRKHIAYVPQDIHLFRGTLRDNIIYRKPNVSDSGILRASIIGLVDQFVNRHPMGFDMPVGEQGYGLSGGQKQSVAIARAFIEENPVVLLDEPSNSMDNTTERLLISRLKEALKGKTSVLVSHKTALMSLVDRLILIDEGKVVMDGPKAEVLKALQQKKAAS
jgi:ATP-binding cassette subfamily C protein LapB